MDPMGYYAPETLPFNGFLWDLCILTYTINVVNIPDHGILWVRKVESQSQMLSFRDCTPRPKKDPKFKIISQSSCEEALTQEMYPQIVFKASFVRIINVLFISERFHPSGWWFHMYFLKRSPFTPKIGRRFRL